MARLIGALDQGTTSTRFLVFDDGGCEIVKQPLEYIVDLLGSESILQGIPIAPEYM